MSELCLSCRGLTLLLVPFLGPCESLHVWLVQGTFLPANVSEQLDDMSTHKVLVTAAAKVLNLTRLLTLMLAHSPVQPVCTHALTHPFRHSPPAHSLIQSRRHQLLSITSVFGQLVAQHDTHTHKVLVTAAAKVQCSLNSGRLITCSTHMHLR